MFRKFLCAVLAMGTAAALAVPVRAAEDTGSIRVTLQNGETVVPDGAVKLYYAGTAQGDIYCLTEEFGGGIIQKEDALSPALARWLVEMAGNGGTELLLDADGSAEFAGLPRGLYLLMQTEPSTGYHLMEPMTVMLPCENQWYVQAYPKTEEIIWAIAPEIPATGQPITPMLGIIGMTLSGTGLLVCGFKKRKR